MNFSRTNSVRNFELDGYEEDSQESGFSARENSVQSNNRREGNNQEGNNQERNNLERNNLERNRERLNEIDYSFARDNRNFTSMQELLNFNRDKRKLTHKNNQQIVKLDNNNRHIKDTTDDLFIPLIPLDEGGIQYRTKALFDLWESAKASDFTREELLYLHDLIYEGGLSSFQDFKMETRRKTDKNNVDMRIRNNEMAYDEDYFIGNQTVHIVRNSSRNLMGIGDLNYYRLFAILSNALSTDGDSDIREDYYVEYKNYHIVNYGLNRDLWDVIFKEFNDLTYTIINAKSQLQGKDLILVLFSLIKFTLTHSVILTNQSTSDNKALETGLLSILNLFRLFKAKEYKTTVKNQKTYKTRKTDENVCIDLVIESLKFINTSTSRKKISFVGAVDDYNNNIEKIITNDNGDQVFPKDHDNEYNYENAEIDLTRFNIKNTNVKKFKVIGNQNNSYKGRKSYIPAMYKRQKTLSKKFIEFCKAANLSGVLHTQPNAGANSYKWANNTIEIGDYEFNGDLKYRSNVPMKKNLNVIREDEMKKEMRLKYSYKYEMGDEIRWILDIFFLDISGGIVFATHEINLLDRIYVHFIRGNESSLQLTTKVKNYREYIFSGDSGKDLFYSKNNIENFGKDEYNKSDLNKYRNKYGKAVFQQEKGKMAKIPTDLLKFINLKDLKNLANIENNKLKNLNDEDMDFLIDQLS